MNSRRRFLSLMGVGAVSAPIAAKGLADAAVMQQANIATSVVGNMAPTVGGVLGGDESKSWATAFRDPQFLSEIRAMLFEEEKRVCFIDADIAVHKSFSVNAKIAFQRQRNVERRIEQMQSEWPWMKMNKKLTGFLGLFKP